MTLQGKRILVTGGAGFIGSHIVDSLVKQNAHVIVYDDFRKGNLNNLENSIKDIEVVKGDILDQNSLIPFKYSKSTTELKIGFVSSNFKNHPIGYFLFETLRYLKDMSLELVAYSNLKKKDALLILS